MKEYTSDLIHGIVVLAICGFATLYSVASNYHSDNIWAVYSAGIAYAAGRAGVAAFRGPSRQGDPPRNGSNG